MVLEVLTNVETAKVEGSLVKSFRLGEGGLTDLLNWRGLALAAVLLALTNWVRPTKKLHPIVFIALSAVVGVVFGFAGA